MRVFVTGATGFLGTALCAALRSRGDEVVALTRAAARARPRLGADIRLVEGEPAVPGSYVEALAGCDAVVNLAGEPIAGRRWSEAQKARIRASRVEGARGLADAMASVAPRPRLLVGGSAVGYYGGSLDDRELDESSPAGADFLATVCKDWEAEQRAAAERAGSRLVLLRTGVVLGPGGGALEKLVRPFRFFAGGWIGSGRQWVSWVHLDDWVGLALLALDRATLAGPIDATAPEPVRMKQLAKAIGAALGRPAWAPVPGPVLRAMLGELSEMLLHGQRVLPRATLAAGYRFRFPTIDAALADLLGRLPAEEARP